MQKTKFFIQIILPLAVAAALAACASVQPAEIIEEKPTVCGGYILPQDMMERSIFLYNYNYMIGRPDLIVLLDKQSAVSAEHIPQDLVVVRGRHMLRAEAAEAFKTMQAAAKADGITLMAISAYRSYDYQKNIYERGKKHFGRKHAEKYIAAPGHSQHQLGTAVDIKNTNLNFDQSAEFAWLQKNAGNYGFSMSFPQGQEEKTGFNYEPWHYRYISPQGVILQDIFFGGSQYDTLAFLQGCLAR